MNKLLLGYFYSIALSLSRDISPAPELIDRAKGYAHKRFESNIRYEDGIDRAEAFAYAEYQILGAIDYNRLPVQRYDRPKKDGDFWRINVFIKTAKGLNPHSASWGEIEIIRKLCQGEDSSDDKHR